MKRKGNKRVFIMFFVEYAEKVLKRIFVNIVILSVLF